MPVKKSLLKLVIPLTLVVAVLAGCSGGNVSPTTSPTATRTVTSTVPPVTETAATTPATSSPTTATAETTKATTTPPETTAATPTTTTATAAPTTTVEPTQTPTTEPAEPVTFVAGRPVSAFTEADIAYLGIDVSGTPGEIAAAIRQWQQDNMRYGAGTAVPDDFSDAIRWNYFLPGIFPSADIIYEHVDNGRVYGICFDFAVVYASIAEYYGLECRIVASVSRPSDSNPDIGPTTGMAPEEYERLKLKLLENGLDYPYDAVRMVAEETPSHYWAEVLIDGEWRIYDATGVDTGGDTETTFVAAGDFAVVDWTGRDRTAELEEYTQRLLDGERLPDPGAGTPDGYAGITDDLNQPNRAASIDDLMLGLALAPYFNDVADAYDFIRAPEDAKDMLDEDQAIQDRYEELSGGKFYFVAFLVCEGLTGQEFAEAYESYCGVALDLDILRQADPEYDVPD